MTASLKLLGGMALQDSGRPLTGQIAQRRRLAVLAILGASRSPVSRDRLVAAVWPELDAEGARHRLSDSVYVARRALGEAAIQTLGDDVWLDDQQVEVDVRAFERALDEGALERAVGLYAGPFLDGFHLSGAEEFERWVDDERARLARRLAQALRTLATDAERRGDFAAAADALRRLAAADPLDAGVTLRLMSALERAGDGAGALRQARIHQTLRHAELGLGEDADIRRASDELAARLEANTNAPQSAVVGDIREEIREPVAVSAAGVDRHEPIAAGDPQHRPARRMRFGLVAAAALVLVALGGWWTRATRRARETTRADAPAQMGVAVFPFTDRGAAAQDVSGEAMAILLATKLDGGAGWRSIDPNALLAQYQPGDSHPAPADAARLAERLGATYFVLGDVVRTPGGVYVGAALYDARTGEPVSTRVGAQGAAGAVFELVDSLATRLLVGRRDEPAPQLARLASLTTSSLPALKEYLEGEAKLRAGQYVDAADHFERAARIDTTFALAYYRLAWAHSWNTVRDDDRPLELAARYGTRLPERFRLTLDAVSARRHGDVIGAERLFRQVIARWPDDFDANYELGDLLFHGNPQQGRDAAEAREPLERAASLDPTRSAEALYHLISIASVQRRRDAVDSLAMRFLLLHPDGELSITVRPIVALVRRDTVRIAQVGKELARLPLRDALRVAGNAALHTGDLETVARLVAALDDSTRAPIERATLFIALANLAGARGDWRGVDTLMLRAQRFDAPAATDARARLLSLPIGAPPLAAIRDARAAIEATNTRTQPRTDLLAALLSVRLGDTSAAQKVADRIATAAPNDSRDRELLTELSARRLLVQHKPSEALAILEKERTSSALPLRFLRGEVLEALGRKDEALQWYTLAQENYGGELYLDAIARARARLGL